MVGCVRGGCGEGDGRGWNGGTDGEIVSSRGPCLTAEDHLPKARLPRILMARGASPRLTPWWSMNFVPPCTSQSIVGVALDEGILSLGIVPIPPLSWRVSGSFTTGYAGPSVTDQPMKPINCAHAERLAYSSSLWHQGPAYQAHPSTCKPANRNLSSENRDLQPIFPLSFVSVRSALRTPAVSDRCLAVEKCAASENV